MKLLKSTLQIGIAGAESSHALAIARALNVDQLCGRARVTHIWGESAECARDVARKGAIGSVIEQAEDMIGKVDGIAIVLRHAKDHPDATKPFIAAGIPVFVDKPFTISVAEGRKLIEQAEKGGAPITSFSVIPEQDSFRSGLMPAIRTAGAISMIETIAHGDRNSPWGGLYFYGIHQVEMILRAFGSGVEWVHAVPAGENTTCIMQYRNGGPAVVMNCIAATYPPFSVRITGKKSFSVELGPDENLYLTGIKKFLRMFRTGEQPFTPFQILEPIAVLEAAAKSLKSGKRERVKPPYK